MAADVPGPLRLGNFRPWHLHVDSYDIEVIRTRLLYPIL